MSTQKARLRAQAREARSTLSVKEIKAKSQAITGKLIHELDWLRIKSAHIYRPISSLKEVDTRQLIKYLQDAQPQIQLAVGSKTRAAPPKGQAFDLVIVPTLAFDKNCNRLGWGGGWYDRFLAEQPQALKIGLCFEAGRLPSIPAEPHDIALDKIISEECIMTRL